MVVVASLDEKASEPGRYTQSDSELKVGEDPVDGPGSRPPTPFMIDHDEQSQGGDRYLSK